MNVGEAFGGFRKRLEITEDEQKLAAARHKEIREYLRAQFAVENDFLTGSYVRDTKTKPLRDVDIFVVLKATDENRERFRSAGSVLAEFELSLGEKYGAGKVSQGRHSVKVDFGRDEAIVSFDVVPAFVRVRGGFEIPDSNLGEWIGTDPTVHADAATKNNKDFNDNWKPLIKMIKAWNRNREDPPVRPSFLIEVMGLKIVGPPPFADYAYEVQRFFGNAAERIAEEWPDPAELGPPVNDEMDKAGKDRAARELELAYRGAHEARRLERDVSNSRAIEAWRAIFGDLFPAA
jgi:predicted nucleotidyltransferase